MRVLAPSAVCGHLCSPRSPRRRGWRTVPQSAHDGRGRRRGVMSPDSEAHPPGRRHLHANAERSPAVGVTKSVDVELGSGQSLLGRDSATNGTGGPEKRVDDPIDWQMTALLFLFPALGGALFGYDIGATSGALVSLKDATTSGTTWYNLSSFQSGFVVSSSLLGALGGSAVAFVAGDKIGRKRELLLAAVLYGTSTVALWAAPNLETLLAARIVYGLGIGFAMHAAPAYIAEAAPAKVRGLLISLKECLIVVGILLGYLTSYLFVTDVGGWRAMYGVAFFPATVLLAGMAWLPDSPRWLLLAGHGRGAAERALARARGRYGADAAAMRGEVARMERTIDEAAAAGEGAGLGAVLDPRFRRPLAVGLSLMLFQQITGQPSVLYYAAQIFESAGFAVGKEATGVSVGLGLFKLVMTGVAVATVDTVGRRPLLLAGVTGLTAALVALAAAQLLLGGPAATWTSVIALLLYVGCYQGSFGPISWLIVGEVFPLSVRGPAAALASLTNFGSNFLVSLVLPAMEDSVGLGATYLLFAGVGVAALATIAAIVPETKGKTLEEIEAMWGSDPKDADA